MTAEILKRLENNEKNFFSIEIIPFYLPGGYYNDASYLVPPVSEGARILSKNEQCRLFCNPDKRLTGLDRFLSWNTSGKQAFYYLQNDFSLERLLELEHKYLQLQKKIAGQPLEKRGFEVDISTKTPFLD